MSDTETNNKSTGFNPLYLIVIIALVAAGGYYFMSINKTNPESPPKQAAKNPVENVSTAPNVITINIEAGSFYFKPNKITVKKGDTVKIVFKAVDMQHNFYLDEFNFKGPTVKSGDTNTFQFVADKTGSFEFYCAVGQHRKNGQVGTLIVE